MFGEHTFYQKHTFGQKGVFQNRARGATLKVGVGGGGLTSDSKWGGGEKDQILGTRC